MGEIKEENFEIVKFLDGNVEIDISINPKEETIWLTVEEISKLFNRDRTVILKHINIIYKTGELFDNITCAKNAHMGNNGKQLYYIKKYNLDVIISIVYRINSIVETKFR